MYKTHIVDTHTHIQCNGRALEVSGFLYKLPVPPSFCFLRMFALFIHSTNIEYLL